MTTKHSKFSLGYHIIWCPKFRQCVLEGMVEIELKQILTETCSVYGWSLESIEVMPDHVHIFVQADPKTAPVDIAKTLKSISALRLFSKFPRLKQRRFLGVGFVESRHLLWHCRAYVRKCNPQIHRVAEIKKIGELSSYSLVL